MVGDKLKLLEWTQGDNDKSYHFSICSVGNYIIIGYPENDEFKAFLLGTSQYGTWFITVEDAKAAAQADYYKD